MLSFLAITITALAASVLSSLAGFGGSLLLLPVLVHLVGPAAAIPIFTVSGFFSNGARSVLGRTVISWRPVLGFTAGAIPGAVAGSLIFVEASPLVIQRSLAGFLILMMFARKTLLRTAWSGWALALAGFVSALLSGIFGFSGPLSAAIFFSLGLSPASYIASEATAAVVIHGVKAVTYQRLNALSGETLLWGVYLGGVMAAGAWIGRRWIDRIPHEKHSRLVQALFVAVALSLLI